MEKENQDLRRKIEERDTYENGKDEKVKFDLGEIFNPIDRTEENDSLTPTLGNPRISEVRWMSLNEVQGDSKESDKEI